MTSSEPPPDPGESSPTNELPPYGSAPSPGGVVPPGTAYGYGPPAVLGPKSNDLALWSMILGIVSFPAMCMCGIGFFTALVALIIGLIARGQIERSQGWQTGESQALAGVVLGVVGMVLGLAQFALFFGMNASPLFVR